MGMLLFRNETYKQIKHVIECIKLVLFVVLVVKTVKDPLSHNHAIINVIIVLWLLKNAIDPIMLH